MIEVSPAWKDVQQRFILPESHIEINCTITEVGAQESASASGTAQAPFSKVENILGLESEYVQPKYATGEHNFWALDGTRTILPNSAPYGDTGYVSNIASTGSTTLSFPKVHTQAVAGLTITWSETYGEYARVFSVVAMNGEDIVAETTITDNDRTTSVVYLQIANYDSITVSVHDWSLPNRRARIEKMVVGHVLTLTKKDILSFSHTQHGDLLSGELPKYSIEFTLDNTDGRWDPNNPTGMEKYLAERQKLTVRYGLDINGAIEWIKGGTFYMSEWNTPSNGIEARFVARDAFEYLLNEEMWVSRFDTLSKWIEYATEKFPEGASVEIDSSLGDLSAEYSPSYTTGTVSTNAEIVQKCANAGRCILRYDRDGVLHVEPLNQTPTDYIIARALSFSHPEISLSKPLKEVAVDYGAATPFTLSVAENGAQQTLSNDFIRNAANAEAVSAWVRDVLKSRKTISGEFRADPRLDLFDIVAVESKYGTLSPVAITEIKYTFNGSFRGTFKGVVLEV